MHIHTRNLYILLCIIHILLYTLPYVHIYTGTYIESIQPGSIHVYYGCRNESDFLFKDLLHYYTYHKHIITKLEVAFSRPKPEISVQSGKNAQKSDLKSDENSDLNPKKQSKQYVTDRLKINGQEIYNLLINNNACIYICGDGTNMAKDVYNVFIEILQIYGNYSKETAIEYIQDLKLRRRYLLDIWG